MDPVTEPVNCPSMLPVVSAVRCSITLAMHFQDTPEVTGPPRASRSLRARPCCFAAWRGHG
eukprot:3878920-Alexandrium_andersonii.AAC.1